MEASCRERDCAAVRLRTCGAGWGSPATPRKELELQGACARVSFEQVGAAHVAREGAQVAVPDHLHDPRQFHLALDRSGPELSSRAAVAELLRIELGHGSHTVSQSLQ